MVVVGYSSSDVVKSNINDSIEHINSSYRELKGIIELPKDFISNNKDEYKTMRNKLVKYLDERIESSFIIADKTANKRRKKEVINIYDSNIDNIKAQCTKIGIDEKSLTCNNDVIGIDPGKIKEIIKKNTAYTINTPREIELYNKALEVVKHLNSLKDELEGVRCGRNRVTPIGDGYAAHLIDFTNGEYKVNANVMAHLE